MERIENHCINIQGTIVQLCLATNMPTGKTKGKLYKHTWRQNVHSARLRVAMRKRY